MKPIVYEFSKSDEHLSSHSGLALIGALLERTRLKDRIAQKELTGCSEPEISHRDIVYAMIGLLCIGKPNYDAIELFRSDPFFSRSLGMERCPSAPTLRQRLDMVRESLDTIIKEESAKLIQRTAPGITSVLSSSGEYVALDIDVSPYDNSKTRKEGVSRTYKGYDGYAPIFAYIGREGYLVNMALREGKQHCQNGTPVFLRESIGYAKTIAKDEKILVRMDSGNDSIDNIKVCRSEKVDWLIKRNMRREKPETWLEIARKHGEKICSREGKTVWKGTIFRDVEGVEESLQIMFSVTERTITAAGQVLLLPEIEVETYWTSLAVSPGEAITIYQQHGECEQYHSELKTDMDLERLPSEYFSTNAVVLLLGMLAYNLLRLCGQESLREDNGNIMHRPRFRRKAGRRRLRTVMQDLMYMACKITHHARKWFIAFGKYSHWSQVWLNIYTRFREPVTV
jgi:hypothetical protein